jgi:uncharacterized protein YndB with AHSA1/START domain
MTNQAVQELTLHRVFGAPRELVFKAFTDPELVKQWWSPRTFTNPLVEIDARPGGTMLVHMQAPDGTIYPDQAVFHEVVPPERLVFTSSAIDDEQGNPQLAVITTITLIELDGMTRMEFHAEVIKVTPEAMGALDGMEQGWSESFYKLGELLDRIQ